MANTRKVLLSLHNEVADRLDEESNKSATVDALVAAHYGLSFDGDTIASTTRQNILDSIKAGATTGVVDNSPAEIVQDTAPVEAIIHPEVPTSEAIPVDASAVELTHTTEPVVETPTEPAPVAETTEPVAPQGGEVQPEPVVSDFVPVESVAKTTSDFVPVVQPLDAVEPTSEVQPAESQNVESPVIEPITEALAPSAEVTPAPAPAEPIAIEPPQPEPVSVQVAPGTKLCPNCGEEMLTPICLNCL